MLEDVIRIYNERKLKAIRYVAGEEEWEEADFLDDGRIAAEIERLKKEMKEIEKAADSIRKNPSDTKGQAGKLNHLIERAKATREAIAFRASNSWKMLDSCLDLVEGDELPFAKMIDALKKYAERNHDTARQMIDGYIAEGGDFANHYLLNKVYGKMLLDGGDAKKAAVYLRRAVRLRPEDGEVHHQLSLCYRALKDGRMMAALEAAEILGVG